MKRRRAQTTLEYAIIIAVVITALLSMRVYFRRALAGKYREAATSISEEHYWPGETESSLNTTHLMEIESVIERVDGSEIDPKYDGYWVTTQHEEIVQDKQKRTGNEKVKHYEP